jgi:two-component system cell cycle sensor histidine kinase/response regulator CckA
VDEVGTVLIIDDDAIFRETAQAILEDAGFEVRCTEDAFEGLQALAEAPADVVFVDYILPYMDGDILCRVLRSLPTVANAYLVLVSAVMEEAEARFDRTVVDACLAKGSPVRMKENLVRLAGMRRDGEQPRPAAVLGREGVHPRRISKELLERKQHLESILGALDQGVLEVLDDRVLFGNEAAARCLGMALDEIMFATPAALFGGEAVDGWFGNADDSPPPKPVTLEVDGRIVVARALPLIDKSPSRVVELSDITEREQLQRRLLRSEKMEAIGVMAAGVGHNFNNLLQGIVGASSLIESAHGDEPDVAENLNTITTCCDRGRALTKHLFDYARTTPGRTARAAANDLVRNTLKLFRASRKDLDIRCELGDELPDVLVDIAQIEQVLFNLLVNAAHAVDLGGTVAVTTDRRDVSSRESSQRGLPPGPYIRISIQDTGKGIPADEIHRIFDPFFTTKPFGFGTGLGLASAYGIVTEHGGSLEVESTTGQGSTFHVLLPVAKKADGSPGTILNGKLPSGTERVLVVDDEQSVLRTTGAMLELLGYTVSVFDSGEAAVEAVREDPGGYDLAIIDLAMPNMNGRQVVEALGHAAAGMQVLLMSGFCPESQVASLVGSEYRFLPKPFDRAELACAVRTALDAKD